MFNQCKIPLAYPFQVLLNHYLHYICIISLLWRVSNKNNFLLRGINILVAEDNKLNQKIANFILLKQNANVSIANNGEEAIEMLKEKTFDVVLMDLHMPVMDGLEAVRYIRQEMKSNVPVIAFTASTFDDESEKCLAAGMDACISKPFDATVLCSLILKLKR